MSKFSNLFTAGIFIIFLAVLFHYFCRVRKKPELVVQSQVQQSPEGYVYPISPNVNNGQYMAGSGYPIIDQRFSNPSNVPYPMSYPGVGVPYPYPYPSPVGTGGAPPNTNYPRQNVTNVGFSAVPSSNANMGRQPQPEEDLPPPYHTVVASAPYLH